MVDLSLAVAHAKKHWGEVCEDQTVWTQFQPINIPAEIARRRLDPMKWKGAFLIYSHTGGTKRAEGLFLIPTTDPQSSLPARISRTFDEGVFTDASTGEPTWHFLSSWSDSGKHKVRGRDPAYTGLNDCAHFVSECLAKAGLKNVGTLSVPQLVANLRSLSSVETLTQHLPGDEAGVLIRSGAMTPGDIMCFATPRKNYLHSVVYIGGEFIAMHTFMNHPDFVTAPHVWKNGAGKPLSNWQIAANPSHPLVTLLHFNYGETRSASMVGWWTVSWAGTEFYYYLAANGLCYWTGSKPVSTKQPPMQFDGKGHWYERGAKLVVAWTSGSAEIYKPNVGTAGYTGRYNEIDDIFITGRT